MKQMHMQLRGSEGEGGREEGEGSVCSMNCVARSVHLYMGRIIDIYENNMLL